MEKYYTNERNVLILMSLMKAHGIKKVIVSPGTTNMCLVASLQYDPYFELYSVVDERSAAYIACGLAAESGEPVALSCTGATASRNYMSGLTEAYYRKLPILAITSSQDISRIGQNSPQLIDNRVMPNDVAKTSVHIPNIRTLDDERVYTVVLNDAILELKHQGGGPVHINLTTSYSRDFTEKSLPVVQIIKRICRGDALPPLHEGRIGIYVGAHKKWSKRLVEAVEVFCERYNAVVFVDHISNYRGKYSIFSNIVTYQQKYQAPCCKMDLMIYIGDIIGTDYQKLMPKQVWRVNIDGVIRDTFGKLSYMFEMEEEDFFESYTKLKNTNSDSSYLDMWQEECRKIREKIPELPFSNIWIAQHALLNLPENCVLHFGIQNSLRTWNFFEGSTSISGYCNTGGFGIDGNVSSLVGASLANPEQLYFGVVGDLAFFYDLNVLGNRHIGNNIRLILVNNGRGQQFRNPGSAGEQFGVAADPFIAAAGHFGNQSPYLIKHYAENLGFEYFSAANKDEFLNNLPQFITTDLKDKPMLFEVFTGTEEEGLAMTMIKNIEESTSFMIEDVARNTAVKFLGDKGVRTVKKILRR